MAIDATNATTVSPRRAGYRFNLTGWISLVIILAWALIAILAPYVTPHGISDIVDTDYFGPMSLQFPLGTDYLGRDMLSRILFGARYTVGISLAATLIACTIGVTLGMAAAVTGGWFDAALSRFVDALSSIPSKLFALVAVAGVGSSIPVLMLILGIIYTPGSYRFARALAVNVNTTDFVTVARIRGEKLSYLIRAEILPNIIGPVLADVGLRFVFIVLLLSGLSFLGLGVQPPFASWGRMLAEGRTYIASAWWIITFPGIALMLTVLAVNLLGDWLRDYLDPRLQVR